MVELSSPNAARPASGTSEPHLAGNILELAFACLPTGPERDARVMRLAALLEEDGAASGEVAALSQQVLQQVLDRVRNGIRPDSVGWLLADLVGKLSLEEGFAEEARALQRRLAGSGTLDELARHADELAGLLNGVARLALAPVRPREDLPDDEALDVLLAELKVPAHAAAAVTRLRERLRHRRDPQGLIQSAHEAARILNRQFGKTTVQVGEETLSRSFVRSQLRHLLENVVLRNRQATEAARIGTLIESAAGEAGIEGVIRAITTVLGRRVENAQKDAEELTRFMTAFTRRLTDFRAQLAQGGDEEARSSAADFQRQLSSQVADLRELVDEGGNLEELKEAMIGQLESLESGVRTFVEEENARRSNARSVDAGALARLTELEDEVEHLRQKLGEEHLQRLLDPLTSVYNRLGYEEGMGREHARWTRHGGQLSLLVLDLDRFKSINDGFGHAVGDKVLSYVGNILRKQSRQSDVVCRFGGEEFAVILPQTHLDGALIFAEKMREAIAATSFRFKDQPVPVTVSMGIAEFRGVDTPETVFERADRALYLAKTNGRNRCCTELDLDARPAADAADSGAETTAEADVG